MSLCLFAKFGAVVGSLRVFLKSYFVLLIRVTFHLLSQTIGLWLWPDLVSFWAWYWISMYCVWAWPKKCNTINFGPEEKSTYFFTLLLKSFSSLARLPHQPISLPRSSPSSFAPNGEKTPFLTPRSLLHPQPTSLPFIASNSTLSPPLAYFD